MVNVLKNQQNKNIILLFSIYFIATLILFLLSLYNKTLLSDEPIYFEIAKNLFKNGKIQFLEANITYDTLLYSFVITPFFGINNVFLRNNLITLFNTLIMCSYIFPLYLICKNIIKFKETVFVLIFAAINPVLLYVGGYMQEILFYPLLTWLIFVCLKFKKSSIKKKYCYSVVIGFLFAILYLCKETGIIFIFCLLLIDLFDILFDKFKLKIKFCFSDFLFIIIKFSLFLLIILPLKFCVLPHNTIYSGRWKNLFYLFKDYKKFFYSIYSFFYYLSALSFCCFFFPYIIVLRNIKQIYNSSNKYLIEIVGGVLFSITLFMATIIAPYEDMTFNYNFVPRCLIRYYGPVLILVFILMFSTQNNELVEFKDKTTRRIGLSIFVLFCLFYKGSRVQNNVYIDHAMLSLYSYLIERPLFNAFNGYNNFYCLTIFFINLILINVLFIPFILPFKFNKSNKAIQVFLIIFSSASMGAGIYGSRLSYKADETKINNVVEISSFLAKQATSVLIISDFDSYISIYSNLKARIVYTSANQLENDLLKSPSNSVPFNKINFISPLLHLRYDKLEYCDYIIFNKSNAFNSIVLDNKRLDIEINNENYILYKNNDLYNLSFNKTV